MMKKTTLLILTSLFVLFIVYSLNYADAPSVQSINAEIEKKYGYPDYFRDAIPDVGDFNYAILEDYQVPVYGAPHGDTKDNKGKIEPRFLGYNRNGESVPNPHFPHDSITEKPFVEMNWFEKPWNKAEVKSLERFKHIKMTHFDKEKFRTAFKQDFLKSMQKRYGKTDKFNLQRDQDFPWENYYHIVLPPTTKTYGVAVLFHRDNVAVWYLEMPLLPTETEIEIGSQLIIKHRLTDGTVIGEDQTENLKETLTLTAPEFADTTYRGYGYSKTSADPVLSSTQDSLSIVYQKEQSEIHYVTFYYEKTAEDTFEAIDNSVIDGDIVIDSPIFDVTRAIPTGETVDITATVSHPVLFDYQTTPVSGTETYTVEISQPYSYYWTTGGRVQHNYNCTDVDGDGIKDACPGHSMPKKTHSKDDVSVTRYQISRSYRYFTVEKLYHYVLSQLKVYNKQLRVIDPVSLTLEDSEFTAPELSFQKYDVHLKAPTLAGGSYDQEAKTYHLSLAKQRYHKDSIPDFDFSELAEQALSDISVRSDKVILGESVLLDGEWQKKQAPLPKEAPSFSEIRLKKVDYLLSHSAKNGVGETKGKINYLLKASFNYSDTLEDKAITGNSVFIHTPVVNASKLEEKTAFDQRVDTKDKPQAVPIDVVVPLHFSTVGTHIDAPGYGKRDYQQYAKSKRIGFPFDVYYSFDEAVLNDYSKKGWRYIKANQWEEVPFDKETIYIRVPHWVKTGQYNIYSQVIALNHSTPLAKEVSANLLAEHDTAVYKKPIEVTERLFDFLITGVNDPRWQPFFQRESGEAVYFAGGSNNKNGLINVRSKNRGGKWPYQLPIVPGKQTLRGYQDAALKLGYQFNFLVKTMGSAYHKNDFIKIDFDFYHIDQNGNRSPVDLYYQAEGGEYIKIGSQADQKVHWAIAAEQPYYNRQAMMRTENALQTLGEDWYGGSIGEYYYLVHGKRKLATYYTCVLDEGFRVFRGSLKKLPEGVDVNQAAAGMQLWYGSYRLPSSTIAIKRGEDLAAAYQYGRDVTLKSGFIAVNAKIGRYNLAVSKEEPLYSYQTDHSNQWQVGGFDNHYVAGDIVYYHIDQRASDDLRLR